MLDDELDEPDDYADPRLGEAFLGVCRVSYN
jgi:hypothetical protein